MSNFPKFRLVLAAAALVYALPASAKPICLSEKGKLLVTVTDPSFCSCLMSLTQQQWAKFRIDPAQAEECLLTTSSIGDTTTIVVTPPDNVAPPIDDGPPTDGDTAGKANNGLGNGSDPAPPGIGNAGNDGGDVAAGSVAVTPGAPGGSGSAPGQN